MILSEQFPGPKFEKPRGHTNQNTKQTENSENQTEEVNLVKTSKVNAIRSKKQEVKEMSGAFRKVALFLKIHR